MNRLTDYWTTYRKMIIRVAGFFVVILAGQAISLLILRWLGSLWRIDARIIIMVHALVMIGIIVGIIRWAEHLVEDDQLGHLPENDLMAPLAPEAIVYDNGTLYGELDSLAGLRYTPEESGALKRDAEINTFLTSWDATWEEHNEAWDEALVRVAARHVEASRWINLYQITYTGYGRPGGDASS